MESPIHKSSSSAFNLVGCISLHRIPNNFGMPWKDYLIPVGNKINALQRAVLECAAAGCTSIWISCNFDQAPYARQCVGDYITDPYVIYNTFDKIKYLKKHFIPIYFVPMYVTDLNVRDSMGWGIVNSAFQATKYYSSISHHVRPDRFYASFVQSCYSPWVPMRHRPEIKSTSHNFHFTFQDKSFKTNEYMGFTFSRKELSDIRTHVFKKGTVTTYRDENNNKVLLPLDERYSGKNFSLDVVFDPVIIDDSNSVVLNDYHNIETWEGYRGFIESKMLIRVPKLPIFQLKKKLPRIGTYDSPEVEYTEEELEEVFTLTDDDL